MSTITSSCAFLTTPSFFNPPRLTISNLEYNHHVSFNHRLFYFFLLDSSILILFLQLDCMLCQDRGWVLNYPYNFTICYTE